MSQAAIIGVLGLLLCSSSSGAVALMMGGEDDKKVGPSPGPSTPPPPPPPVVVDVPQEFRTATNPWGTNNGGRDTMKAHNRGTLDGDLWAADVSEIGKWYQMDNGKIADIVGVAIKGRKSGSTESWGPQYVKTFKVKYYDAGTWKDVDGGATFTGNTDHDTLVEVKFATPVKTRYIRIYPQTWNKHMSLRAGLITNSTLPKSELKLLNIPADKRAASSWWNNNDDPNWHPNRGTLNSGTGWHIKAGGDPKVEWYEMQMDTPTKVAGVALQGRGDGNDPNTSWVWQWITTFTAKYKDSAGQWKDVDNGFVYSGVNDKDTIVWVPFNTPVSTTAVRIYPKSWHSWPTGRFDLLGSTGSSSEGYEIGGGNQEITGFSF
jgi:hypothetical protein